MSDKIDKMKDKFKNAVSKIFPDSDKRAFAIIAAAIILIGLVSFAFRDSGSSADKSAQSTDTSDIAALTEKAIEEKIKAMVESIDGAGNAGVSVSLESTGTIHYAQDINEKTENASISKDSEYIYTEGTNGSPDGLVIRVDGPVIRGVAVVCDGGGSAVIRSEIKSMISSLYAIGSDRIYVGK